MCRRCRDQRGAGWPQRFDAQTLTFAAGIDDASSRRAQCHDPDPARGRPVFGDPTRADAVIWGDSHGAELSYALGEVRTEGLVQQTRSGCPPVIGYESPGRPACALANRAVLKEILGDRRLRTIYLAGYWASHAHAPPIFWHQLDATLAQLVGAGRRVVLVGAVPFNRFEVPRSLANRAIWGGGAVTGRDRQEFAAETAAFTKIARRWQQRGVVFIDPVAHLCPDAQCQIENEGKPLYFDAHHLSLTGARLLIDRAERAHRRPTPRLSDARVPLKPRA